MKRDIQGGLRKLGQALPGTVAKAVSTTAKIAEKPLAAAAVVSNPVEAAMDAVPMPDALNPVTARRLKRCTIPCQALVTGMADLPGLDLSHGLVPVTLLRVRLGRPAGEVETCVRVYVPEGFDRVLHPGWTLPALGHEEDPRIVAIDWGAAARATGNPITWMPSGDVYAWPDRDDWPPEGAIAVYDSGWRSSKLDKRRAEWTPAVARLTHADSGGQTDGRVVWKFALDLPDGRRIEHKERAPALAMVRLIGARKTEGRFVTTTRRIIRVGAPIAVLLGPGGDVAIDWEMTLSFDELRAPAPL